MQVLDRYFGNVCELDLIFNFHKAYYILDELLIAGERRRPHSSQHADGAAAQRPSCQAGTPARPHACPAMTPAARCLPQASCRSPARRRSVDA